MRKLTTTSPIIAALACITLTVSLLLPAVGVAAQGAVPPPTKTPLPTATQPGTEPTDTPVPPTHTPMPRPTDTAIPPTDTPVPPTHTPMPKPTNTPIPSSATPKPTETEEVTKPTKPKPVATERPDPNCQSVVEGNVLDGAGQRMTGVQVSIEGDGWSRAMLTNDAGHYGFGGLCPGTATLRAAVPGGPVTAAAPVSVNGKDHVKMDLSLGSTTAPAQSETPVASAQPPAPIASAQPPSTPQPAMPATGFQGWLLLAVALTTTALLLLTAGMRRILVTSTRNRS